MVSPHFNCTKLHQGAATAQAIRKEFKGMASIFKAGKRWRVQIRRTGLPTLSEYFETKQDAQRWARQQEADIDRGKRALDGLMVTVSDVFEAYDDAFPNKVDHNRKHARRMLEPHFGKVRLDDLGTQTVINYAQLRRRAGAGPSTILNNLSFLRSYLSFGTQILGAVDAGALAKARVVAAVSLLSHNGQVASSNERNRRPSEEELEILYETFKDYHLRTGRAPTPMWDMILFAIATTMRLGEIVELKRRDLNSAERTIWIRDRKHPRKKKGNDEEVPLLAGPFRFRGKVVDPYEILMRQPPRDDAPGTFFPMQKRTVSKIFGRDIKGKIEDLHFHDLRHDGISRLFEAGYPIERVALVSGHKDWKSLKRYTQLKPKDLHTYAQTLTR
jgi:integrase